MRKTLFFVLSVVLVFSLVLAGCSGNNAGNAGNENSGNGGGASGEKTDLSLWTFVELHQKFYESMAEKWNAENPSRQINLKAETLPYDDMHNKLLVALQSGTGAPDIADIEISKFANFLKGTPQLVELNRVVEPVLNDIVKSRVDIYAKDGKYYGVCFHVGAAVIYYNKEILDAAGVNADDIKTWDDFAEAGKTVLAKTGKPMTSFELTDQWSFWPMISQAGADYLDKDGKPALDNPTTVKVLKFQQQMLKDKTAILAPGGGHHSEEYYGMMNQGGSASVFMPMWYMGRFTDYMPDLKGKIMIRPMPAWEEGGFRSAGMGGTGTTVTKQSKNQELAIDFVAYCKLSEEGNIEIWKQLGFDPINTKVWDRPELKEPNKFTEYFGDNIFDTLIEVKDEINAVNVGEKTPAAADLVRKTLLFKTLNDNEDPAKVAKEVQAELSK